MNRSIKRIAVAAATITVFGLGAIIGILATEHHDQGAASTASVSSYDDGWATSKQDDCEQGDANACAWLGQAAQPKTASAYSACLAYVDAHSLASDICEPLDPGACAYYAQHHYAEPDFCVSRNG